MARVTRRQQRLSVLKNSLSLRLDEDGEIMIKCAPMFKFELRKILREIKEEARQNVVREHSKPDKGGRPRTGKLRKSIQVGEVRQVHPRRLQGTVTAGSRLVKYAKYVHDGTPPHVIRARRAKALRFWMPDTPSYTITDTTPTWVKVPGKMTSTPMYLERKVGGGPGFGYVKSVKHPGIKRGSKFLTKAAVKVVRRYGGTVIGRDGRIIERQ